MKIEVNITPSNADEALFVADIIRKVGEEAMKAEAAQAAARQAAAAEREARRVDPPVQLTLTAYDEGDK